ncbi:MAG: filamentous hemagglutinin N-terminal domain-containing protein, partial [Cyanobacteria bacterium P01_H01_bin.15]
MPTPKPFALPLTLLAAVLSTVLGGQAVNAQSIEAANDGTLTIVTKDGKRFTIDGGSLSGDGKNLFHSFEKFGLSANEIATFLATPQLQNILSRVTGGDPSLINGLIEVVGGTPNVYLMNPAGIVFGPDAQLNVPADFTATTASGIGFQDGWFNAYGPNEYFQLSGEPNSFQFNDQPGAIINAGDLSVEEGQNLTLAAGTVVNAGSLEAPGGSITIAAVPGTNRVKISRPGGLLSLEVEVPVDDEGQQTAVRGVDLPELLTGPMPGDVKITLTAEGDPQLTESGTTIPSEPGTTIASGEISTEAESLGGEINVLGERVGVYHATIDASGGFGGGRVQVGGDFQGEGSVPLAEQTVVDSASTISADAQTDGPGGEVVVWSEDATVVNGTLSAKGGPQGGDGGLVEISSRGNLAFAGSADTSAPQGVDGTVLFDPQDILIVRSVDGAPNDVELGDGQILFGDGGTTTKFVISDLALRNVSGTVILQASRDLLAAADADLNLPSSITALLWTATRNVNILADIDTAGADVVISAQTGSLNVANINTANDGAPGVGGDISLNAELNITAQTLSTGASSLAGGNIDLSSTNGGIYSGDLTASGSRYGGDITLTTSNSAIQTGNIDTSIELTGRGGSLTITGDSVVTGGINTGVNTLPTSGTVINEAGIVDIYGFSSVQVGNIRSSSTGGGSGSGGVTIFSDGAISVRDVDTSVRFPYLYTYTPGTAGDVTVDSYGGQVIVGNIKTDSINYFGSGQYSGTAGAVSISGGSVTVGSIDAVGGNSSGSITLVGDEIDLIGGNDSIRSSGTELALSPFSPTTNIVVDEGEQPSTLDLSSTDLAAIQGGFAEIKIGQDANTGDIFIGDSPDVSITSFDDSVSFTTTGNIVVNNSLAGINFSTFTNFKLQGNQISLNSASIVTEGLSIAFEGAVVIGVDSLVISTGALGSFDQVIFTGTLDGDGTTGNGSLVIASGPSVGGSVVFDGAVGATVPLKNLDVLADNIFLNGEVSTNDNQTYFGNTLSNASELLADVDNDGTGDIISSGDILSLGNNLFIDAVNIDVGNVETRDAG